MPEIPDPRERRIVEMPTADVRPYDNNPRDNSKSVDSVMESIKRYGFQQPILVDAEQVVIAGHTRLAAAKKLGLPRVPVMVVTDLTPEQVKEYRIADNRAGDDSQWDADKLAAELAGLETGESFSRLFNIGEIMPEEIDGKAHVERLVIQPAPETTWVLIGIPTARYHEIYDDITRIGRMDGVFCEAGVSDKPVE